MSLTGFLQASGQFAADGQGQVVQTINGHYAGRVVFETTYWTARLHPPQPNCRLLPGTMVQIVGREGLTLLVSPVANPETQRSISP